MKEMRGVRNGFRADVAQLVEHSLGKGEVTSSILVIGSTGSEVEAAGSSLVALTRVSVDGERRFQGALAEG